MNYKTSQEKFWAGEFGDNYIKRTTQKEFLADKFGTNTNSLNQASLRTASDYSLFSKILQSTRSIQSVIEFGSNIGLNLLAIQQLLPGVELSAIEINQNAVHELKKHNDINVHHSSILDFQPERQYDLVLIKCVLIHINPKELQDLYELLYKSSEKYICLAEYYNTTPVEINYRGHEEKLFKRDFAGEMLDKFPDLDLIDYGFVYHRDNNFKQDDINWFILEKTNFHE